MTKRRRYRFKGATREAGKDWQERNFQAVGTYDKVERLDPARLAAEAIIAGVPDGRVWDVLRPAIVELKRLKEEA